MHRFYLPPEQCSGPDLVLVGPEAHHARQVVRVRLRERITVLDGIGHEFICDVEAIEGNRIVLKVVEKSSHAPPPGRVTLLQAVPKGRIMEDIIQKATELGVSRIVPLLTERVITRLSDEDSVHRAEKWQLVARESIKQCGAPWLPVVEPPVPLSEFLERKEAFELPLIASLQTGSRPARDYFRTFEGKHKRMPHSLAICIGPEGDFAPAEIKAIENAGYLPITLGPLVLRVETAAIYCLSILSYELQSALPNAGSASRP